MSGASPRWFLREAVSRFSLRPSEALVFLAVADRANENRIAWPSQRTLADQLGINRRTVQNALDRLAEAGLLQELEAGRRGRSARYRVPDRIPPRLRTGASGLPRSGAPGLPVERAAPAHRNTGEDGATGAPGPPEDKAGATDRLVASTIALRADNDHADAWSGIDDDHDRFNARRGANTHVRREAVCGVSPRHRRVPDVTDAQWSALDGLALTLGLHDSEVQPTDIAEAVELIRALRKEREHRIFHHVDFDCTLAQAERVDPGVREWAIHRGVEHLFQGADSASRLNVT